MTTVLGVTNVFACVLVRGACVAVTEEDGTERIQVDPARCIGCGACMDACKHGAREFEDDTEQFFADLAKGEKISILLAPAFKGKLSWRL